MADKVLRWYIDGNISTAKVEVGGTYRIEGDWKPVKVSMTCRVACEGTSGTVIDINDDGVSIFSTRPSLLPYNTEKVWTTINQNTIRDDSIITLDIDSIASSAPCRDLTVELFLEEA